MFCQLIKSKKEGEVMKKNVFFLVTAFCCLCCFTVSCDNKITVDENPVVISTESRSYAEQQFAAANDAFRNLVESKSRSVSEAEIDPEDYSTWPLADRLEAAAWLGILNDDSEETIRIAKEYGVYEDLMDIVKEYDLENCVKIRNSAARSAARSITSSTVSSSAKTGDIFLSHSYDSSLAGSSVALLNTLTRGYYKHSGIYDKRIKGDACVLSASNNNDHFKKGESEGLGAVGYEYMSDWTKTDKAVGVVRVKNATEDQCKSALDKGKDWLGKPYGLSLNRKSDDTFYCSKVVYRCWLSQGFDLEYNTAWFWRGLFVTPQDLYDDSDTVFVCGDKA